MTGKRERVAKAIFIEDSKKAVVEDPTQWADRIARVAIAALEEPEQPSLVEEVARMLHALQPHAPGGGCVCGRLEEAGDVRVAREIIAVIDKRLHEGADERLRAEGFNTGTSYMTACVLEPLSKALDE